MDFSNFGTKDMGIDIGSSKLRVTFEDKGIVLEEPTLIVVNKKSGQIIATGMKAQNIMEQNPITLKAVRPVENGQIIDIDYMEIFMRDMIKKVYKEETIFRNVLGALLDKAQVGKGQDREIFIDISWKKYSSKNKYDNLLNNQIEHDLSLPVRTKLKEHQLWFDYLKLMRDGKTIIEYY